jgi:prephenate dehydratase
MDDSPLKLDDEQTLCALEQYSFSDEAAQLVREKHPQLKMQYATDIEGVWDAVTKESALGVIPFENSSQGVVWDNLDRLMKDAQPLQIIASVRQQVRMCVGGKAGTTLENVRTVYSHPAGLRQSARFISDLPAGVQKIECSSTVDGAKKVAESLEIGNIALASRSAIEIMGLRVIAEDVADLPREQNVTKFFVVSKNGDQKLPDTRRDYHAAIITPNDEMGVLAKMLNQIANCNVNLVSIHSRSVGDHEYAFFMDMEKRGSDGEMGVLDEWLRKSKAIKSVKWLGSWDENVRNYFGK